MSTALYPGGTVWPQVVIAIVPLAWLSATMANSATMIDAVRSMIPPLSRRTAGRGSARLATVLVPQQSTFFLGNWCRAERTLKALNRVTTDVGNESVSGHGPPMRHYRGAIVSSSSLANLPW